MGFVLSDGKRYGGSKRGKCVSKMHSTLSHSRLTFVIAKVLDSMGYRVSIEQPFFNYRIDVYGKKHGKIIMIECGTCSPQKLHSLRGKLKGRGYVLHVSLSSRRQEWMYKLRKYNDKLNNKLIAEEREDGSVYT